MPADDLILDLRQIAGYPPVSTTGPADAVLIQQGGLGGPYASISPSAFVSTALSTGGALSVGGQVSAQTFNGGSAIFSNANVNLLDAQTGTIVTFNTIYGTIGGVPIASTDDVSALGASLLASTVWSVNGRRGDVRLTWLDVPGAAPIYAPRFTGSPRAETPPPWSCSSRLATTAFVHGSIARYLDNFVADHPFVFSFNGRTGDIVLTEADIEAALSGGALPYAPLDSPNFSGIPTAPTAAPGSSTGQLATTAFVMAAVEASTAGVASFNTRTGAVTLQGTDISGAGGALLLSPVFTGNPQAPTASLGTNTNQIATTAFVMAELAGVITGVTSFNGRTGSVVLTLADVTGVGGAPIVSPAFSSVPTAPTAAPGTNTVQLATCAFVTAATANSVLSFNGRTGAITLTANDLSAAGGLTNPSTALTGVPTAPTAVAGTSTTQLATTAFVQAALSGIGAGVTSFNTRAGAVTLTQADVSAAGGPYQTQAQMATWQNRNRIINGQFIINQRSYVSGTALASGAYGNDRWKAGASGCTYTYASNTIGQPITITAGSLVQVIESGNIEGGTYTLSWVGSAQGRVNSGAYAASPITVAGLPTNTNVTVEFSTGTVDNVQFELGTQATPFDWQPIGISFLLCMRYYQVGYSVINMYGTVGWGYAVNQPFTVPMRTTPTMTETGSWNPSNVSSPSLSPTYSQFTLNAQATNTGNFNWGGAWTASAEL